MGLLLALLLAAVPSAAAADTAPAITRRVLDNGLRVLVREAPAAGVVAISFQVRGGSGDETAETAGLTHFLHRAMLRGTARHTAVGLMEAAEALGGALDTSADADVAEIRATALARHWEAALGLVAEVALTPRLADDEIERERRLLLGQIQSRLDNPFPFALDTLLADLYGGHPYGLPSLGRPQSIERATREALLARYRALYRADRAVLAVSGRVPPGAVVRAAERLFGRLPAGSAPDPPPPEPPAPPGRRRVVERPAHQAQVLMGWIGPALEEADYAAVKVLAAVLGGGMSGRLFVQVRDVQGLAYSLGMFHATRRGPGPMVAYLGTAGESADAAEAALAREIERLRVEGATESEVARARAWVLGALAMDRRTNARHAWYLAFYELVGAGWDFPDRHARAVAAVTAADVTAAARRRLGPPTTAVLRPRG
ncbi:MAG TPA: pitrilysin family protein [Candidatus Binatia bacterium]|nr:pitrilysin family protein [Candidatus Binatia bacterium]